MTSGTPTNWPDRTTDPALSFPPRRNFDGGLLQRFPYTLTQADALALLRLRRPWSRRARVGFGLACVTGGMLVALLPTRLVRPEAVLLVGAVLIAGAFAARGLWRRRQAAHLVPIPRPAVFEEWIDCIAATQIDGTDEDYLSPELIGAVLLTPTHVFVHSHSTTLVIPTRALPDAPAMAAHLRELARGPYYFEPQD